MSAPVRKLQYSMALHSVVMGDVYVQTFAVDDYNRVVLKSTGPEESDYINASFVDVSWFLTTVHAYIYCTIHVHVELQVGKNLHSLTE